MSFPFKVKKIDLTKRYNGSKDSSHGCGCRHDDIKTDGTNYLAKITGKWYVVEFSEMWYGLVTNSIPYITSYQLDYGPDDDGSDWEELYEIIEGDKHE